MRSRNPRMLRPGPVFAICLAGLALAVAITLAQAAPRPSGTNLVKDSLLAGYGAALNGEGFEQSRYLLPLLPLYATLIALAARAGGRRFGPTIGVAVVALAIGHGLFSQLLTIARYYA